MSNRKELVSIPTLTEANQRVRQFGDNLKLIREYHGLGATQLAQSLGVGRLQYYRYVKGEAFPHHPVIWESVMIWADRIRQLQNSSN